MSVSVKLGPNQANLIGNLPAVGGPAPAFILSANDLSDKTLKDYAGKNVVMNIFPSVDTSTCATSIRKFNEKVAALQNTVVLCISKDLPFAQKRFCGTEGIDKALTLSDFRSLGFGKDYGVEITSGNFTGLFARAIVVIDPSGKIKYTELVPQIGDEPNYDAALKAI
ncbi:putative thiol peroxidase [Cytophagales bacterium WSM2-2]|nr:putative thiol peroxidase [Cytophagales bacterium WSM2-2]